MLSKVKKGGCWCSAPNCRNNSNARKDLHFFRFPKDNDRSKRWVVLCKRQDLLNKDGEYLSKNCRMCSSHFESIMYTSPLKERLLPLAEPTLFDIPNPPHPATVKRTLPSRNIDSAKKMKIKDILKTFNTKEEIAICTEEKAATGSTTKSDIHTELHVDKEKTGSVSNSDIHEGFQVKKEKTDLPVISSVESYACYNEQWLEDNKCADLPIITSVESCTHDEKWLEEDLALKADSSDQESDAELITDKFVWRHEAVRLLIEHYRRYKDLLKSTRMKKKDVWQKIAKLMQKQGYAVTAEMCAERWDSLYFSYKECMENNGMISTTAKKWEYYQQFHDLYWKEIVSFLDVQNSEKINAGVQTIATSSHFNSLESEPTCSSTISSSTPVSTDCNSTLMNLSTQRSSDAETKDDPLLHFLKKKHQSDVHWQLQMKELAFKNIKLQEQTNETLNKLNEILVKYVQEH